MTFLVDFGIKSGIVLGVAFLLGFALRRGSASVRYAIWTCALAAVLVLPLASWIAPRWNIDRGAWRAAGLGGEHAKPSVAVVIQARRPSPAPEWPRKLPMMIWMVGALAMLSRLALGHLRVRLLFGKAEQIHDPLVEQTAVSIGLRRRALLKRSAAVEVPLSYGFRRATVLLPGESKYWSEERRRIVLAHEMIHARRFDSLWGALAQSALAANWFNPLAWLAVREFRKEQERSCDDAVVAAGIASTVYAAHLVDLARSIAILEPALGMAERFDLEERVQALLDVKRGRGAPSRKLCAAMFIAALALVVPLAALHAQAAKASISGSVYDPSGAVIPGAAVSLKNNSAANEELARSDASGRYKLSGIESGEYIVKVMVPGFVAYQKILSLGAGTAAAMDVHLAIGEVKMAEEIVGKRGQPQAAAASPQRLRVGGMVQPVKLISKVSPDYPADAQAEGVEGTVLLRAIVSKDGALLHITQVNSNVDPRLVRAAMAAVPLWRYQPTLLNGEPVEVMTTIDVTFRLN